MHEIIVYFFFKITKQSNKRPLWLLLWSISSIPHDHKNTVMIYIIRV